MTELRLTFEYDPEKAASNLRKHGVSFEEAVTSFFDLNAISGFDEEHSTEFDIRFTHIALSTMNHLLFVVHNEDEGRVRIISARLATQAERRIMKKSEMPSSSSPVPSQRGKYTNMLQQGTNIAVLDPDLLEHFPDSESVNNALRAFLAIGQEVESASTHAIRKSPRSANGKRSVFDPRAGAAR